ncbi:hypothetical protein [Brucella rhizosphaerae]|uniref:hypothetical protein n=1 Tax=Brucella rhizosphaerae TaxID=571254 RepID=UPI000463051C|nr:hypothetical protein [Brucella rhizosphaerae]
MNVIDVLALKWLDPVHTILGGTVKTSDLGVIPICIHANYDTEVGRQIWADAHLGKYGPIFDYQEPEPGPEPVPDDISRRQFFQYLAVLEIITRQEALAALQSGAIPGPLQAIIDQLPTEDDRFEAQMFIIGAQNFNRLHPLSETVRLSLGWSAEQKDDFWREAYKL